MRQQLRIGCVYRYLKSGGLYEVLGRARVQIDPRRRPFGLFSLEAEKKIQFVFYRSLKTGSVWFRPESEFLDGRFEFLGRGCAPSSGQDVASAMRQNSLVFPVLLIGGLLLAVAIAVSSALGVCP